MEAIYLRAHGGIEQVAFGDVQPPQAGPGEVLLSVRAAALNGLDFWVMRGWPALKLRFPHVLGCDGAGVVAEVGADVADFQVGQRVAVDPTVNCGLCEYCCSGRGQMCRRFAILGEHLPGFYAQYIAVPARNLLALPDGFPFTEAAAASLVFVTAWHSLIKRGGLRAGEEVLIVGAGGGVNTAAIQIARLAGAGKVYVVGSDDEKLATAQALGADVLIDRRKEDWSAAVHRLTNRRGVDVVVDNVGAATFQMSLRALAKGGRLLTVGNTSGPKFEFDNRLMFGKHLSIIGSTMGPHQDYVEVMQLIFAGKLRPVIGAIYPLREGIAALERMQAGDFIGKLVLEI
jgi:NADPH:quinone reductase-like Zn-dependent oxidoreductase